MNNLRQTMSLGIGGFQGRKGIKASQPLRIASFPLLAAFFGYLLLLLTEGNKKKLIYTQINDQFVNLPYGEAGVKSFFCANGEHLIHRHDGPPSPQGKACEESGNLNIFRQIHITWIYK